MTRKEALPPNPEGKANHKSAADNMNIAELMEKFLRYHYEIYALGTCCIILLAISSAINSGGILDAQTRTLLTIGCYVLIAAFLLGGFLRIRVIKSDLNTLQASLNKDQSKGEPSPDKNTKSDEQKGNGR